MRAQQSSTIGAHDPQQLGTAAALGPVLAPGYQHRCVGRPPPDRPAPQPRQSTDTNAASNLSDTVGSRLCWGLLVCLPGSLTPTLDGQRRTLSEVARSLERGPCTVASSHWAQNRQKINKTEQMLIGIEKIKRSRTQARRMHSVSHRRVGGEQGSPGPVGLPRSQCREPRSSRSGRSRLGWLGSARTSHQRPASPTDLRGST